LKNIPEFCLEYGNSELTFIQPSSLDIWTLNKLKTKNHFIQVLSGCRDCYNATDKIFEEPPNSAKRVGLARRAGGKGKGKASAKGEEPDRPALFPTFPPVSR